jgi:diguanylate cyclase (GGDEF)-like protein
VRGKVESIVESWYERCEDDDVLREDDDLLNAPELIEALASALERPQPISAGPDDVVRSFAGAFAEFSPPVTIAARQLLHLETVLLERVDEHFSGEDAVELHARSHVLTTWLVTHAAAVRLRTISLEALRYPLRGLFSKIAFHRDLQAELERISSEGGECTVVAIDLDQFKRINDTRGHDHGDEVLKSFAAGLAESVGDGTAYHLSGDEFALILRSGAIASIAQRAEGRASVRCSYGVTAVTRENASVEPDEIHARADQALLHAKQAKKSWWRRVLLLICG